MAIVETARSVILAVVTIARDRKLKITAAGLGFYMFNALVPLVLMLALGAAVLDLIEPVVAMAESFGTFDPATVVETLNPALGSGNSRGRATLIAVALLAWSAFTLFQATNGAFNDVYGTEADESRVRTIANSLIVLGTVLLVLILFGVGVATVLTDDVLVQLATVPLLYGLLFAVFLPMYYRFPRTGLDVSDALPGAAFAALTWTVGAVAFRIYVGAAQTVELYGVAGGLMLLLTWLYLGSYALLLGVALNAVLAGSVEPAAADTG